jgi:hypothetical protein
LNEERPGYAGPFFLAHPRMAWINPDARAVIAPTGHALDADFTPYHSVARYDHVTSSALEASTAVHVLP